jgi:hypothetical protein
VKNHGLKMNSIITSFILLISFSPFFIEPTTTVSPIYGHRWICKSNHGLRDEDIDVMVQCIDPLIKI